jgi:hypothetical protein
MVTLVNRAKMTIVSTGTGTLTLGSAVDGFQNFGAAGVADGDMVRYVIEDGNAWEIGTGIYAAAGPSLTRSPSESSAGGARIPLSGAAVVFITATTADIVQPGDNITKLTNDAGYTANPGTVTSVAAAAGAGISVSGAPVTSSGTLTITNTAPHQPTNLDLTGTGNSRTLTSSTGSNVTLPVVTTTNAGLMATGDKLKLDGIAAGAQVNVATNLSITGGTTAGPTIHSSTGSNVTFPTASGTVSGAVTIGNQTFAGVKTFSSTIEGSVSGNAATATALQNIRSINGVDFNGTANITLPTVNTSGNQTIGGTKTFSSAVILSAAGTATTHAVRADRSIGTSTGLSGGGNLTANRTIALLNIAAGSSSSGALFYNGTGRSPGRLYGGTTNPVSTTRLNYDGNLHVNALTAVGDVTAFSDARLKADFVQIPDALAKVSKLTGYTYTRKDTGARHTGLIAQDVQKVLPEAVIDCGDHLTLAYGNMVGLLIEAIKELNAELEELKHGAS